MIGFRFLLGVEVRVASHALTDPIDEQLIDAQFRGRFGFEDAIAMGLPGEF